MSYHSVQINVNASTEQVERVLRVISKHATACADELAAIRAAEGDREARLMTSG